MNPHFKPYELDQYIDGELNPAERLTFESRLKQDTESREQICVKRQIKAQIAHHYKQIKPIKGANIQTMTRAQAKTKFNAGWGYAAAGLTGLLLGIMLSLSPSSLDQANSIPAAVNKFVIHLDNNDEDKMAASVQKAGLLLKEQPKSQVQIITNHEGIELFNAQNANAEDIIALLQQHQNLELVACLRTLERIEREGKPFDLIPAVNSHEPAVDEVVKRLKDGWTYIKI